MRSLKNVFQSRRDLDEGVASCDEGEAVADACLVMLRGDLKVRPLTAAGLFGDVRVPDNVLGAVHMIEVW